MSESGKIAELIAHDYYRDRFDISARNAVSSPSSWSQTPPVECATYLREMEHPPRVVLLYITFICAISRGNIAAKSWWNGLELLDQHPEVFDPISLFQSSTDEIAELLNDNALGRNSVEDAEAWFSIAQTIALESNCPLSKLIYRGVGDAKKLLKDLATTGERETKRFPILSGPKTSSVLIRLLANPGGAEISHLDAMPISVDAYVCQATENLGMSRKTGLSATKDKEYVQSIWKSAIDTAQIEGPPELGNSCAALESPLAFFSRYGCGHCAKQAEPVRISVACNHCRLLSHSRQQR